MRTHIVMMLADGVYYVDQVFADYASAWMRKQALEQIGIQARVDTYYCPPIAGGRQAPMMAA